MKKVYVLETTRRYDTFEEIFDNLEDAIFTGQQALESKDNYKSAIVYEVPRATHDKRLEDIESGVDALAYGDYEDVVVTILN